MTHFFNHLFIACDAPRPWGIYFQDSASPQMEALVELHDNIMFYLVIILFGVAWIIISVIRNYVNDKSPISNKYLNHGTLIELIWTITPALILILIAFPSFKLLYLMDEVTDPSLTVFVEGHQWYWSYQYPDFLNDDDEELEFDSVRDFFTNSSESSDAGSSSGGSVEVPERHRASDLCLHENRGPYPDMNYDPELLCDVNATWTDGQWVKHAAWIEGGLSPTYCEDCHFIFCRDCDDHLEYDSDAPLGSSPPQSNKGSDSEH